MNDSFPQTDADAIMVASTCYNELFRKTALRKTSEIGMTKTQVEIMVMLKIEGPMKMSELSDRLFMAREQVTRAVNSLKEQQLVESARSEENRKNVVASLTEKGYDLLTLHKKASDEMLESYLTELTIEDRKALIAYSKAAAEILRRYNFMPGAKK